MEIIRESVSDASGGIKTYITVKDGEISSLRVSVGDGANDMGPFRSRRRMLYRSCRGRKVAGIPLS